MHWLILAKRGKLTVLRHCLNEPPADGVTNWDAPFTGCGGWVKSAGRLHCSPDSRCGPSAVCCRHWAAADLPPDTGRHAVTLQVGGWAAKRAANVWMCDALFCGGKSYMLLTPKSRKLKPTMLVTACPSVSVFKRFLRLEYAALALKIRGSIRVYATF